MTRDVEPYSSDWRVRMDILDYLCSVAKPQEIFFLWRPYLRDPNDEMVLEVAIAGGCSGIVSYNARDFTGIERFNLTIHTPKEFLEVIGALP